MYPAAILFELFLEVGDDLCNPCSWPDVRVIHEFPPAWGGGGPLYGSAVVRSQWLPAEGLQYKRLDGVGVRMSSAQHS